MIDRLYIHEILKHINPNCRILQFADDILIYAISNYIKQIIEHLNDALNTINDWLEALGLEISPEKTHSIIFTRKRNTRHIQASTNLEVKGKSLAFVNQIKFLGVIFDSRLRWSGHITHIKTKLTKALNIIKWMSGTKMGRTSFHPTKNL